MGIKGLLPQLRNIIERKHVSQYAGHKVAVDTYSWLHKGTYCCALELCTGAPTDKCCPPPVHTSKGSISPTHIAQMTPHAPPRTPGISTTARKG